MATNLTVTLKNDYSYEAPKFAGYGYETRHIYTFVDDEGKVYVWKTTNAIGMDVYGNNILDQYNWEPIYKGDVIEIRATIKGESEYKGQPQTEINRVKVLNRIFKAKTPQEIKADKEKEQRASLQGEDFIWKMPYKQYKEHYSDCETVVNSFERPAHQEATIEVIVREGRLKNSGVRGKHFRTFILVDGNDEEFWAKAMSEENAIKQAKKLYPDSDWKLDRVAY